MRILQCFAGAVAPQLWLPAPPAAPHQGEELMQAEGPEHPPPPLACWKAADTDTRITDNIKLPGRQAFCKAECRLLK